MWVDVELVSKLTVRACDARLCVSRDDVASAVSFVLAMRSRVCLGTMSLLAPSVGAASLVVVLTPPFLVATESVRWIWSTDQDLQ